ncbi:MAG: glucokinase [Thermoanaerobaculia bacterium]
MILAADIGGTKTTVAAFALDLARDSALVVSYPSREHAGFGEILDDFLARHRPAVEAACVGVAGPVEENRCRATNLPWVVDGDELARRLGLARVRLLNDLEAVAHGIAVLGPEDWLELAPGAPGAGGNRAVIAAGTGLGEAGLFWDGREHHPFATEGGHADFAPRDELEADLLAFLRREHGRVSWERVLSGPGIANLYRFLRDERGEPEPAWLAAEVAAGDAAEVISRHAADGTSPLCVRALDLFVKLYGAEAGNLALQMMASGGLYVAGGIAPKNLDRMRSGAFLAAFRDKGRMRPLLKAMPVRLVLEERVGLLGAACRARMSAGPTRGEARLTSPRYF